MQLFSISQVNQPNLRRAALHGVPLGVNVDRLSRVSLTAEKFPPFRIFKGVAWVIGRITRSFIRFPATMFRRSRIIWNRLSPFMTDPLFAVSKRGHGFIVERSSKRQEMNTPVLSEERNGEQFTVGFLRNATDRKDQAYETMASTGRDGTFPLEFPNCMQCYDERNQKRV